MLPFRKLLHSIESDFIRPGFAINLRNANRYDVSSDGLIIPGYLWNVDREVDMRPIKFMWKARWESWKCYKIVFERRIDESEEQFQLRMEIAIRQIQENGRLPADVTVNATSDFPWDEERTANFRENMLGMSGPDGGVGHAVTRIINADRVEKDPTLQHMISQIFIHILTHLYFGGELALANSIWFSIRAAAIPVASDVRSDGSQDSKGLPDDVCELLKLLNDKVIPNRWMILQLDRSNSGTFHQVWIIERIMKCGTLWAGNYTRSRKFKSAGVPVAAEASSSKSNDRFGRLSHKKILR